MKLSNRPHYSGDVGGEVNREVQKGGTTSRVNKQRRLERGVWRD